MGAFLSVLPSILGFGGKLIGDKGKREEFAFKTLQLANDLAMKMLDRPTVPWVDALVKLAYASEQIIKGLFRPIGAGLMTGFVIYAEVKGIELSGTVETLLVAAFPGWMASRHTEKKKEPPKIEEDDFF